MIQNENNYESAAIQLAKRLIDCGDLSVGVYVCSIFFRYYKDECASYKVHAILEEAFGEKNHSNLNLYNDILSKFSNAITNPDAAEAQLEVSIDAFLFFLESLMYNSKRYAVYNFISTIVNVVDAIRVSKWISIDADAYSNWKVGKPLDDSKTFLSCNESKLAANELYARVEKYMDAVELKISPLPSIFVNLNEIAQDLDDKMYLPYFNI